MIDWSINTKAIEYDIDRILRHIAFNKRYKYRMSRVPYGFVAVLNRFTSDLWNCSNDPICPICGMKHEKMYMVRNHVLYSHRFELMDAVNMLTVVASYIEAVCMHRYTKDLNKWICLECGFKGDKMTCVEHVLLAHAIDMYCNALEKWRAKWLVKRV